MNKPMAASSSASAPLVGRVPEMRKLAQALASGEAEFVAIYGHRVGNAFSRHRQYI